MKFLSSTLATLSLSIIAALATPETSPAGALERRAQKCRVNADGARCRRTPSLSADAIGEFFVGDTPSFACFSIGDAVDGSTVWDRTTKTVGGSVVNCFISDTLIDLPCPGNLSQC
ncbi:hypothetical protein B0H14DRAFT_3427808 [Mycena olivaceomarginata]|nr:hypothetical protein B0H14DRAFT_3427808 [Mycena olivaceomarginata]